MEIFNHSLWLLISYQSLGFSFFAIYLFINERYIPRLYFGLYLVSLGVNIFLLHLQLFEHDSSLTSLFPFILSTSFTLIPLFYLLLKSQLAEKYRFEVHEIVHFIPFIISSLTIAPFWILITSNRPEYLDLIYGMFLLKKWPGHQAFLIETSMVSFISLQMVFYMYKTNLLFVKVNRRLESTNCKNARVFISGCKTFAWSFFMLIVLLILRNYLHIGEHTISNTVYILALITLNIGHAYFGMQFSDKEFSSCIIGNDISDFKPNVTQIENKIKESKYENSCLCEELKDDLLKRLIVLMEEQEPYLKSNLKIEDLAAMLNTNSKYLSQIINEHYNKNFANYLNGYRCNKVIKLFDDPSYGDYSLDGIAETCGFHSRSSFVAAFKKTTGQLPSVYRNSSQNAEKSD
jgi:AraC-like DNA-binding protein